MLVQRVAATLGPSIDNQIAVALIAALGGIITTWLTVKYKDRVINKITPDKPKSPMDKILEGYERLIVQQQKEIDRKQTVIENLEEIIDHLEKELSTTRDLVASTKDEVAETKRQNIELKDQLKRMRREYGAA